MKLEEIIGKDKNSFNAFFSETENDNTFQELSFEI